MPGKYQPYKCLKPVPFVVCTGITAGDGLHGVFRYCVPLSRNYYKLLSRAIVFSESHHPHENLEGDSYSILV